MGQGLDQWGPWTGIGCNVVGAIDQAGVKQTLSLEQLPQEWGSALAESPSQSPKWSALSCITSKSALGPSSQTYRTKDAVTVLTVFFYKYLKIVSLETTKMSASSRDCLLLFIEDLRLGSHLDVFFKG